MATLLCIPLFDLPPRFFCSVRNLGTTSASLVVALDSSAKKFRLLLQTSPVASSSGPILRVIPKSGKCENHSVSLSISLSLPS
ncbi:hypothetical protein PanWU01x14_200250 [Parasponia andersonii]|uniref:Uncharacterized protein n=1 Tax=Parasponia andersonii TaxID=3476 RepID=A0A2P5BYH6_PARAD|nr:hypothetical protein PanWU01x14_200250 [Parasponia andersonii]